MHVLSAILLSLSANSDAFLIGISYGAKKIHINLISNIAVSIIAGLGTFLSMLSGYILNRFISQQLGDLIGGFVLILFSLYMFVCALWKKSSSSEDLSKKDTGVQANYLSRALNNPEVIDTDNSNTIDFKEALALGALLCINNIGLGIGASVAGLNPFITSFFSFIFSMVFLQAGCRIGQRIISDRLYKYSDIISAGIILILGLYEILF